MTGNWFAIVALFCWPIVSIILYKSTPVGSAAVWTILGSFLLLPSLVEIKFPMIPPFDKSSIPNVCALLGCILLNAIQKRQQVRSRIIDILIIIYIVSPIVTSMFNNDAILIGGRVLPGVGLYDAISAGTAQLVSFLPFFVGRRFLRGPSDTETIIRALVVAGLCYSVPILFELRMSPQLSNWIYGYFPSTYAVEGRYGGYRPVVFMNNGLTVAFFVMTCVLASIVLWRAREKIWKFKRSMITFYLAALLVLCKSAGSLVYGIFGGSLIALTSPRFQVKIAALLVGISVFYPLLRATDLFPTKVLVDIARSVSEERGQSIQYRFDNEDHLLAHASERFFFGWGRFGRNRVYDQDTGNDNSTTDGLWIITLGTFGLVGFLAQFGLLALPVWRAVPAIKFLTTKNDSFFLATLALIVALTLVEQLPNASLSPWTWLLAGALLGRTESLQSQAAESRRRPTVSSSARPRLQVRT